MDSLQVWVGVESSDCMMGLTSLAAGIQSRCALQSRSAPPPSSDTMQTNTSDCLGAQTRVDRSLALQSPCIISIKSFSDG